MGLGEMGVGTWGWVRRFRVIAWPVSERRAVILQCGAEKRPLRKDRESDSVPHPQGSAGGSNVCLNYHQPKPRMGLYRDGATLYKCTPTKTADHTSPPHYTQVHNSWLCEVVLHKDLTPNTSLFYEVCFSPRW